MVDSENEIIACNPGRRWDRVHRFYGGCFGREAWYNFDHWCDLGCRFISDNCGTRHRCQALAQYRQRHNGPGLLFQPSFGVRDPAFRCAQWRSVHDHGHGLWRRRGPVDIHCGRNCHWRLWFPHLHCGLPQHQGHVADLPHGLRRRSRRVANIPRHLVLQRPSRIRSRPWHRLHPVWLRVLCLHQVTGASSATAAFAVVGVQLACVAIAQQLDGIARHSKYAANPYATWRTTPWRGAQVLSRQMMGQHECQTIFHYGSNAESRPIADGSPQEFLQLSHLLHLCHPAFTTPQFRLDRALRLFAQLEYFPRLFSQPYTLLDSSLIDFCVAAISSWPAYILLLSVPLTRSLVPLFMLHYLDSHFSLEPTFVNRT